MDITINFTNLYTTVARSLSIIAKRSVDDNGESTFKNITLGTREVDIISDYLRQAAIDVATELSAFITASTDTSVTITMPDNYNSSLQPFVQKSYDAYCVSYALYSWLFITAPRLAEKYSGDCTRQIQALVVLLHQKKSPTPVASSPLDINTNVETISEFEEEEEDNDNNNP